MTFSFGVSGNKNHGQEGQGSEGGVLEFFGGYL